MGESFLYRIGMEPISLDQQVQKDASGYQEVTDLTKNSIEYVAAAGADNVIKASAGYLVGILVGKDVSGGVIEVSNHASDGDGDVVVYLEDPAVGFYPVGAYFDTGICSDLTTQTNVAFIYR